MRKQLQVRVGVVTATAVMGMLWASATLAQQATIEVRRADATGTAVMKAPTVADWRAVLRCGGWSNRDCPDGYFCQALPGVCDTVSHVGVCARIPGACPRLWDPVCGCDGRTYANRCEAARAEVSIDYRGECEPRRCWSNLECDDDQYCLFDSCAAETGECVPRPEGCFDVWDPVCGCDGVTYSNRCYAARAGVTVDHDGECEQVCGGIAGIPCPDGQYCHLEDGHCCCDFQGICEPIPQACPDVWDPVCGCDGVTYGNRCEAAAAGQSIDHEGPCGQVCGGIAGIPCPEDQFCMLPLGHCCCDFQGVCTPYPSGCLAVYDPVCGCDGHTYGNACDAAMAGMSIDYFGECVGVCEMPIVPGPCQAYFPRWAFDASLGQCVEFIYGGCMGNDNNFLTKEECEAACPPVDVCDLPIVVGPCEAAIPRWAFDSSVGHCVLFIYGGCQGNANNFETQAECEEACPSVDICSLPLERGPCRAIIPRWGFDPNVGHCVEFIYGGCEGNANNFETQAECEEACPPVDVCSLPLETGPCLAVIPRWGYSEEEGQCVQFIWGGCGGNANNYETLQDCQRACMDVCSLPFEVGPCDAVVPRWAFIQETGQCEEVIWGGCGGNANNFETKEECEAACPPVDLCSLPLETGPCLAVIPRWGFSEEAGGCVEFIYGGCGGNANNFETLEECQEACG